MGEMPFRSCTSLNWHLDASAFVNGRKVFFRSCRALIRLANPHSLCAATDSAIRGTRMFISEPGGGGIVQAETVQPRTAHLRRRYIKLYKRQVPASSLRLRE